MSNHSSLVLCDIEFRTLSLRVPRAQGSQYKVINGCARRTGYEVSR